MLVRLYKSSSFVQDIVIILAVMALWLPRFFTFPSIPTYEHQPIFDLCFGGLFQFPYLSMGIALLLLLFAAFVEQQSLRYERMRVSGRNFPFLLFVVFSATPYTVYFSPATFVMLVLAVALLFLLKIPETLENDHLIFFSAFFFGIAALFYLPALLLMAIFIIIPFFGDYSFKKASVALLGFLLPVIWAVATLYLSSNLEIIIEQWKNHFVTITIPVPAFDILSFVVLSFLILTYILIIFRILSKATERTVVVRRRVTISIYLALFILLGAVFSYNFYEHLSLLTVPMVALISYYYSEDAESSWIDYALIGCFVILVVYSFLQI
jgi:hypothetical protein